MLSFSNNMTRNDPNKHYNDSKFIKKSSTQAGRYLTEVK